MKRKPSTAKLMGRHISRSTWHNTTAEKSILPGTRSTAGSVVDSLPCGVVWGAVLQVSGSGFQVFKMFVDWLAPLGLLGFGMALALNRFRQWKHLMPIRYQIAIRVPRHWQLSRTRFAFVMRSWLWESAVNSWDRVSMAPHSQSYGAVASPQNHTGIATAVSHAGFDRGERETTASLSLSSDKQTRQWRKLESPCPRSRRTGRHVYVADWKLWLRTFPCRFIAFLLRSLWSDQIQSDLIQELETWSNRNRFGGDIHTWSKIIEHHRLSAAFICRLIYFWPELH